MPKRYAKEQYFRQRPEQCSDERNARTRVFSEERSVRASSDEDNGHRSGRSAPVTPCESTTVSESGLSDDCAPIRAGDICASSEKNRHDSRSNRHIRSHKGHARASRCVDVKWQSNALAGVGDQHDYRQDLRTRGQQVLLDMATLHSDENAHGLTALYEKPTRQQTKRRPSSTRGMHHVTTTSQNHPAHHHMRPDAPDFIPCNTRTVAKCPRLPIPPPPSYPPSCGVAAPVCPAPECPAPTHAPSSPNIAVPEAAPSLTYRSEPASSRMKLCQLPLQQCETQVHPCAPMPINPQQQIQDVYASGTVLNGKQHVQHCAPMPIIEQEQFGSLASGQQPQSQYGASTAVMQRQQCSAMPVHEQQPLQSLQHQHHGLSMPNDIQQECVSTPMNESGALFRPQEWSASIPMIQYNTLEQCGALMTMNQYGPISPEQQYGASMTMNQCGAIPMPMCMYGEMSSVLTGSSISANGQSATTMLPGQPYVPTNQFACNQFSAYDCSAYYKRRPDSCADVKMTDVPMDFDFLD